jgi:hypothetical protein
LDPILEKALETANLMTTLANQKRALKEEYEQSLFYFYKGGTFKATRETISFVQSLINMGYIENIIVVDDNNLPINIENLKIFLENLLDLYTQAANTYFTKYEAVKKSRNITSILDL